MSMIVSNKRRTGYVYEEIYLWHDPGSISYGRQWVQPGEAWENPETKGRFHSLISATGLVDHLVKVRARSATREEVLRFHTIGHHDRVKEASDGRGGDGDFAQFGHGSYEIALHSVGGVLAAVEALLITKTIDNAYCLVRPPGHHAVADQAMGFCLFNNVALGALHARALGVGIKRIAIVDYDVHHGNGTQDCFWHDPDALFISLHQDNNYPQGTGMVHDIGGKGAEGTTINVPLPPGSGNGAYHYAFEKVVLPALTKFRPDLIFVSSGFDASYVDPLGRMMVSSKCFGWMAARLQEAAEGLCGGRVIFAHEGGYSKEYVPFCGLAVVEAISGVTTGVAGGYTVGAQSNPACALYWCLLSFSPVCSSCH
jgi:acetoin utilization deacetylase AcuC-like enzyme